jgi:hypothetical protein
MWWSPQEDALQKEAEAAWEMFPEAMPGLPDIAEELEEAGEDPGGQPGGPADVDQDDPPVFQWHLPEGAPEPEPAGGLLNGFHAADLIPNGFNGNPGGLLAAAMGLAGVPFDVPQAEDEMPD